MKQRLLVLWAIMILAAVHPMNIIGNSSVIDATSELDSIEQQMLQQEQATEQAFVALQLLLNSLASTLAEHENSVEITEHFAALLLIVLHNSLALANDETASSSTVDTTIIKNRTPNSTEISETEFNTQSTANTQTSDNRPAEKILASCATLASNLASIIAAPRNPIIVGQSVANSIVSLASIIKCALESRKKDKRGNHYASSALVYTTIHHALEDHFRPLLAAHS